MSISGRAARTSSASAPLPASAAKSNCSAPGGHRLRSEARTNGSSSTTRTLCTADLRRLVLLVDAHQRGQDVRDPRERSGLALDLEVVGSPEVERDPSLHVGDADAVK